MLDSPNRLKRFLGSLIVFGPLIAAALISGETDAVALAVVLAVAAVIVALIVIWDRRNGGGER